MRRWGALLAAVVLLTGCSAGAAEGRSRMTVFAAASLTEALTALAQRYEERTGARVDLSFAGSQSLVAQVQQGAPADLVVTADEDSMAALADDVVDGAPVVLARNALAVVTEAGDPLGIGSLADLARPGLAVVLGGPDVPVGRAARAALATAGVPVRPVSEEPDVKAVLAKVRLGEADAGVVYATDLAAAGGDVGGFALPGAVNSYPAAVVRGARNAEAARDLIELATSGEGRQVLADLGFLPP